MMKHGCFSKAMVMGLFLACAVMLMFSAGPTSAAGLKPRKESTAPAAKGDPGRLTWISRDATYEASSIYGPNIQT